MKKSILVSLAVCIGSLVFAGAPPSGHPPAVGMNIVGYTPVTLRQGYNMLALNFDQIGSPTAGTDLNDLIPGKTANLTAGNADTADQVLVYSGGNYAMYYLYYSSNVLTRFNYKWVAQGPVPCTNKFKSGDAFWYNKRGAAPAAIMIAGQVPEDASRTHAIAAGYNMIGSVYATDWAGPPMGPGMAARPTRPTRSRPVRVTANTPRISCGIPTRRPRLSTTSGFRFPARPRRRQNLSSLAPAFGTTIAGLASHSRRRFRTRSIHKPKKRS